MVDIKYSVLEEEFIPTVKAKEILEKIEEPNYEQKLALEHTKKFGKLKNEEAERIIKELGSLEMRKLKNEQIVKILDIMPEDIDGLKTIFMYNDVPFKDEELEKILQILKKK